MRHVRQGKRGKRQQEPTGLLEQQSIDALDVRRIRVSKALWPRSSRRAVALHHTAFRYGRLAGLSRCWSWLTGILGISHGSGVLSTPVTPMPVEPPLVRVLETIDLSRTDVEHFFKPQEERHTAELSLDWLDSDRRSGEGAMIDIQQ